MAKKKKGGKRGKLTGAAKTAFLKKMAAGRARAAGKRRSKGTSHRPRAKSRSTKTTSAHRRAVAMKNLAKAHAKRRANKRAGKKHPVNAFSYHRPAKTVHVPRHMSFETAYEGRRRRGQTAKQRAASMRNLRKARAALGRPHKSKKGGHRPKGAKKNPLSHLGTFGGALAAGAGFGVAALTDRGLATHPLTDKNVKDANGNELYADNPPATGPYAGLFNPTAICAPMNLTRWAVGGLIAVVPLGGSFLMPANGWKTATQMFGVGALLRLGVKGFTDLTAMVLKSTKIGQRLFDGEMRAAALKKGDGSEASLPSAGLGSPGCGTCANCTAGVGCCSREVAKQPAANAGGGGGGVTTTPAATPPPAPGANSPAQLPQPAPQVLTGVPDGVPVRRNPYRWGDQAA